MNSLIFVILSIILLMPCCTYSQESFREPVNYYITIHGGLPFYYANNKAGSERGRSFYLSLDKQINPKFSLGVKPQLIQYYSADNLNKYSYLNKHLDLTLQLKRQIVDNRFFKIQVGGGLGVSYSDYIPYARYYWSVSAGYPSGTISNYIYEIQPIIDPMIDITIPISRGVAFQLSGGTKIYFLNYAMKNTGLNYSNNDLLSLTYFGGGLRFKLMN